MNFVFPLLITCYLSACLLSLCSTFFLWLAVLSVSPLPYFSLHVSVHSTFLLSFPASHLPLCLGLAGRLLRTVMGMHTDVCRVYVCVQEERAADSWAKAKTYTPLRKADSEEEREID